MLAKMRLAWFAGTLRAALLSTAQPPVGYPEYEKRVAGRVEKSRYFRKRQGRTMHEGVRRYALQRPRSNRKNSCFHSD